MTDAALSLARQIADDASADADRPAGLRVAGLEKAYTTRFGTKQVLKGVNFELSMGERLGILGRNGAGKSTLIRVVSGAERPSAGTVESNMSISWPLAFGGAFNAQLTGADNIRFISRIYNQDVRGNLAFVEEFAELGPYLREPVRSYSSGMRARLAFAISMIIEFDCFLIDEIASVGDARFHDRCNYELFDKRGDRAMIIVSHDAAYIRDNCNRWAILHEGEFVPYDDFEVAYAIFKDLIGWKPPPGWSPHEPTTA
jgi:ABC-type polysaccharide/polyol phosphate transport system ATPase subunit